MRQEKKRQSCETDAKLNRRSANWIKLEIYLSHHKLKHFANIFATQQTKIENTFEKSFCDITNPNDNYFWQIYL